MTENLNSPRTTGIQRLGHVLGWAGNSIAALMFVVTLVLAGIFIREYFIQDHVQIAVYEVTLPNQEVYNAVGYGPEYDALEAVKRHTGTEIGHRHFWHWEIVPNTGSSEDITRNIKLAEERAILFKTAKDRRNALTKEAFFAVISLVLTIVAFALGRALRYIFAGPKIRQ